MLLERSVSSFLCLGELVDDIDVVGALSFLVQPQTVENNIAIATGVVSCPIYRKTSSGSCNVHTEVPDIQGIKPAIFTTYTNIANNKKRRTRCLYSYVYCSLHFICM
jgi:hypothetical protein